VREAYALLDTVEFDVAVIEMAIRGVNGIALVREMRRRKMRQPILVLTMTDDADIAAEALAAGANGSALKSDSRAVVREALSAVARGERYIADSLPRHTIERFLRRQPRRGETLGPLAVLSAREREVFDLLSRGYGNDAIAGELGISFKTVDSHRTKLFRKLSVHSLGELLHFGFRHRLIKEAI